MANIKQSQQAETYGSKNESRLNRLSTSSNDHENLAINKTGQSADTEPVVKIEAENNVRMKKSINLLHSVAILVAVTGHVSVFISPTAIFRNTDSVGMALIMWLIGGLLNLCMALIYTELGTIYPKAGGPYLYVLNVFGPLPAFLILWGYFIMITGPFWAFVAYTAALYTVQPIMGCKPSEEAVKVLAAWLIVTLVTLNCVYMKYVTKVQTLLSSTKLLGLILIITGGAVRLAQGETNNIQDAFTTTTKDPGKLSFAVFFSIFSYGAWQILSGLMEEVKDPGRDIPRAVYISFLIVVVKYILANLAYFIVLTPQEILETDAIAVTFTNHLYPALTPVISVLVGVCCIGVLNASIMGHSRLLFAGARYGHAPVLLNMLHTRYLTPWPAIVVMMTWALIMLFSGGLTTLMEFIQLFSLIMSIFVVAALLYLRWSSPHIQRPYKINICVPVVMAFLKTILLVMCIVAEPVKMGIGLAIFFTGFLVYFIGIKWTSKPKAVQKFMVKMTIAAQKAFLLSKSS